ncbi:MAG: TadE/TadG family type IV pilus assembly protein [Phyllobacterium sp.]
MMAGNCRTKARRFFRDDRGVAALEFALVAPILILLYLGSIEVTGGLDIDRKLARAANMVADLVTQEQGTIAKSRIADIMNIGTATLLPYRRDTPQITVTAIEVSDDGSAKVAWSRRRVNGVDSRPFTPGSNADLDADLRIPGTAVIRVDTSTAYVPLIAWTMENSVLMSNGTAATGLNLAQTAYGRVRQGGSVACGGC